MNIVYEKIKKLLNSRSMTINELCKQVEMTERGFHAAVKNNSLKLKTVESIADVLQVPISYFFDENQNNLSQEVIKPIETRKNKESYFYELLLEEKDKRIGFLEKLVFTKLDRLEAYNFGVNSGGDFPKYSGAPAVSAVPGLELNFSKLSILNN